MSDGLMSDVLIIQEAATVETVEPGKAASLRQATKYHLLTT